MSFSLYVRRDIPMKDTNHSTTGRQQRETFTAKRDVNAQRSQAAESDSIDRRNFLSCMAWAGAGLIWTMAGGVPASRVLASAGGADGGNGPATRGADFSFVQISDSHIGFNKAANQVVSGTLKLAIEKIN